MMPSQVIFADTSFLIGFFHPRDQLHKAAVKAFQKHKHDKFVTSEMILDEFLNFFGGFGSDLRAEAADFVELIRSERKFEVVDQTHALFDDAFRKYKQYLDKEWSLTDCSSFVIMKRRGISLALTHDKHFKQAGFTILLP